MPPIGDLVKTWYLDEQQLVDGLALLLDHGADPLTCLPKRDYPHPNRPIIHVLAFNNRLGALKYLASRGIGLSVKDAEGRTTRQAIEYHWKALARQHGKSLKPDAADLRTLKFLKDYENGKVDVSDYAAIAAMDKQRKEQQRRDVQKDFSELGKLLKAVSKVDSNPTQKNVAKLATLTQEEQIKIVRFDQRPWVDAASRDTDEAKLAKAGYKRIGLFGVRRMPAVRMLAMIHPIERVYAAVCEQGSTRWTDLVRFHKTGTRVTVTNARIHSGAEFSSRQIQKMRHPGRSVSTLIRVMRERKPPRGGVVEIQACEFPKRFEDAYAEEMAARRERI